MTAHAEWSADLWIDRQEKDKKRAQEENEENESEDE